MDVGAGVQSGYVVVSGPLGYNSGVGDEVVELAIRDLANLHRRCLSVRTVSSMPKHRTWFSYLQRLEVAQVAADKVDVVAIRQFRPDLFLRGVGVSHKADDGVGGVLGQLPEEFELCTSCYYYVEAMKSRTHA